MFSDVVSLQILDLLQKPLLLPDLATATGLKRRQLRYQLQLLLKQGVITKYPNLQDLRQYYYVKKETST